MSETTETINIKTKDDDVPVPKEYVICWGIVNEFIDMTNESDEDFTKQERIDRLSLYPDNEIDCSGLSTVTKKNLNICLEWYKHHFDQENPNQTCTGPDPFKPTQIDSEDVEELGIDTLPASYHRVQFVQKELYIPDTWDYDWINTTFSKLNPAERNSLIKAAYELRLGVLATLMTQKLAETLESKTREEIIQELSIEI